MKADPTVRSLRSLPVAALLLAGALVGARGATAQERVDFERDVLPILEKRCVECHRAPFRDDRGRLKEPKADLRLDGKAWILRGSEAGEVVIPGAPDDSELYLRTILPADDPDVMPHEGDRLTDDQTTTIRRWIASGAGFGDWVGAAGPASGVADRAAAPEVKPRRVETLERLAHGLAPLGASSLRKAAGDVAQITPALPNSGLLRVEFFSHQPAVGDAEVHALKPLRQHVAQLDLGRTKITDAALATVGRMPRLVRLDLRETAVSDSGILELGRLQELRHLNLFGTAVTDRGLDALAEIESLQAVYLLGTGVTARGVDRLRQALPGAKVHWQLALPEVPPRDTDDRRGRRRRR